MSSIGGNVATNAGGLCCVKYGVTRDYVMGLEVVLTSGEVIHTGRRTIKSTAGLDLTGLFIGSEGVLGIITEITLRLVPAPPVPETAVAYFADLPSAGRAIVSIFQEGLQPTVMEIIDRAALSIVEGAFPMGLDLDAACLLLMQSSADDQSMKALVACCEQAGSTSSFHATDPDEGDMLLEVRRRVWPAAERLGKGLLPEDVAVARERLPELLAGIERIAAENDLTIPTIGHAGDGNLHPLLVFDAHDVDERSRAERAFADIVSLTLELGGTIAAEHGIGLLKREFLVEELAPNNLALQRDLKSFFDPDHRLNPGKAL